ncbi:hypothetical protein CJ030_MR6G029294 [Morella rubra]|uniref:Protein EDS1L n=1 Tax=Morella rubra TaxID=262757 RepID=A0A6A1VAT3_9ROSI|nr:hypothetical protein CJ030_MR6G029294 [Morella rubra]
MASAIGMREELIIKACSSAMNAHRSPQGYILEEIPSSSDHTFLFSFRGSWSATDWFAHKPFGETDIKLDKFPSLRSIGNIFKNKFRNYIRMNEPMQALKHVHMGSKDDLDATSKYIIQVEMAVEENEQGCQKKKKQRAVMGKRQVVFTGHSAGGPMAILATLWFLERAWKTKISPLCVTFGCPLTGDHIFSHALVRENWASCFKHFVMRYDIVPRMLLAPITSIEQSISTILHFFETRPRGITEEASDFYETVMRNASAVASHAACKLMGNTNLLVETVTSFIPLSPYKPFGTYIFCTGNGSLVVLSNPDAVLQLLFYSCQLGSETEGTEIAHRSLEQHLGYENELQDSLQMQVVHDVGLTELANLPLSGGDNSALNDLGLSTGARLCLRAAAELEKRKQRNKAYFRMPSWTRESLETKPISKKDEMKKAMQVLDDYRKMTAVRNVGYYDAFKLQKTADDFNANVKRLELAGIWDEIIEMLKRYELPDGFERDGEWIKLGTRYRRLVEPLDIANYYRHSKNEDTGPYTIRGRPKRYRYTQRWREHAERMVPGSSGESHFWADVEELRLNKDGFEKVKDEVLELENNLLKWVNGKDLDEDVLLEESTFVKWWKTLPIQHKEEDSAIVKWCKILPNQGAESGFSTLMTNT